MSGSIILIALLVVGGIWYFLNLREEKRVATGLPRHSGLRLVFAAVAALTILFSGGCGLAFLFSWIADGMRPSDYVGWEIITILSLPPVLIGLLIWWLAMRRGHS